MKIRFARIIVNFSLGQGEIEEIDTETAEVTTGNTTVGQGCFLPACPPFAK